MKRFFYLLSRALLLILVFFCSQSANGQTFLPRTVNIIPKCQGYYEYLPVNYSSNTNKYPLILYLHGGASFGNGTTAQLASLLNYEGVPYYINKGLFPKTFTTPTGEVTSYIAIAPQFTVLASPVEIMQVLTYILNNYRVDQSRIYLTGYSVGGGEAWYTPYNLATALRFAALSPVAGGGYSDTTAKFIAGANLPVWAIHSDADQTVSVNVSINMVNKINSYNPPTRAIISILSGVTHNNTVLAAYDPTYRPNGKSMYEWFLQYRRNNPPVVNQGNDTTITLPATTAVLDASKSSDPEGSALTFGWAKLSGPSQYAIANPSAAKTNVSNLVSGVYVFRVTVTDSAGLTSTGDKKVTVINPFPNQLPVAVAGNDTSIFLPATSVNLKGSGSYDTDGAIQTYAWTKISGPTQYSIASPALANTTASNLKPGVYGFELAVTDNDGGVKRDTVLVTVINPFPNILPVARAGVDQNIYLPGTTVNLDGSASTDADGVVKTYQWRQLSGPAAGVIANPNVAITSVNNLITAGSYKFELKVVDDSSGVGLDTMIVTVNPAVTQRMVKVNLYGGTNPAGTGWNNWNVNNTTLASALYSDGTASPLTATITASSLGDNGAGYPTTMCPPEVGRYASYSTGARTLTLSGLDTNKIYDFEAYASRQSFTNITTTFTIGNINITIATDRNYANKALFTNLKPSSAGRIILSMAIPTAFNYLNGFTLTEYITGSTGNNSPPIAVAGTNQSITLPVSQVTLNGSGSSDPDGTVSTYKWTKLSGPASAAISKPDSAITTVTGLVEGIYQFQLAVTDNQGAIATNITQVTVTNPQTFPFLPPTVTDSINCGKTVKIVVIGSSTAVGQMATPVDSSWVNKLTKYVKSKNALNSVINIAANGLTTYEALCPTGFVPPTGRPAPDDLHNITAAVGFNPDLIIINLPSNDVTFGLTVQETQDNYERAMLVADARHIPVWVATTQPIDSASANALSKQIATRDWIFQRFGAKAIDFWTTIANPDGSINDLYQYPGDLVHLNNNGHHVLFTRVVGERLLDSICLRANYIPVASAGIDTTILLPVDSVQISGAGSYDSDGTISSYNWTKLSGPASYSISSATVASPKLKNLVYGDYQLELKVTDNQGAFAKDTVWVHVRSSVPIPPVAIAGPDSTFTLPLDSIVVSGAASSDIDGTITGYNWTKVLGPDTYFIVGNSTVNPLIKALGSGVYVFELTVTDNSGLTAKDSIQVTVNRPPNKLPVSNAGVDITVPYPGTSAQLNGIASSDPDGTIVGYSWAKVSGPPSYSINDSTLISPTISSLTPGTYTIILTVKDNDGATAKDTVKINVDAPPNKLPVAAAGSDVIITLPINSVQLNGNGSSDIDGTISSYKWTKISGPATFSINNTTLVNPVISNLVKGIYQIELAVTDNSLGVSKDTMVITVYPAPNTAPVARAGTDQTITLPTNSVTLSGSTSTDADGVISTFLWRQISTNPVAVIATPNLVTTTVGSLVAGSYQFELTVTDDSSATARDTVLIIVNPAPPVVSQKFIQVNLYAGSNPAGTGWNNWNVASLSSGALQYSDGTASTITAALSSNTGVGDNGAGYPTTMCPPAVGRYASYSTILRTLTFSGLDNSRLYNFEAYSSRLSYTTISTKYTVGTTSISIFTDRNYANKAVFNNIAPSGGKIVITVEKPDVYSYINGFTLIENITQAPMSTGSGLLTNAQLDAANQYDQTQTIFKTYPNPFVQQVQLQLKNKNVGKMKVSIIAQDGKTIKTVPVYERCRYG